MTDEAMSVKLSGMKKTVSARDFVREFPEIRSKLAPGQSVTVTHRGKPIGDFVRERSSRIELPNFLAKAQTDGAGPEVGERLLARLLRDEAFS